MCMFDNFHLMFNFNAKVLRDIFKTKIECQLTYKLYSKCHLNFGLHNILEKLIFWFIKTQSWFLTKKNKIKKKKPSIKCKYSAVLHVSPNVQDGSPIQVSTSSPKRETRIRASRVFEFNLLHKWLLIAFCLENLLSQIAILDEIGIILC